MTAHTVGYKANAFEARNLAYFFLLSLGFPFLLGLLNYSGIVHNPSGLDDPILIPWALLNLPIFLGPSSAAFLMMWLTEGKPGVRDLWRRFWNRDLKLKWLLVALLLLPGLRLLAGILTQVLYHPADPLLLPGSLMDVLVLPLLGGLFSGMHEEFGWRGYALPRFQAKWNALVASLLLGLLTAAWHVPAFFMPGEPLFGRNFLAWLPWHMLIQIVGFTFIFNNTNGNVLAVVLFHTISNVGLFMVEVVYYWVLLAAAIVIVVVFGPKDFVREKPTGGT